MGLILLKHYNMLQQAGRNFSREYKNYIGGKWVQSQAKVWTDQICPLTQDVIGVVPETTEAEFNAVVQNSADAFKTWKYVPVSQKVRYMLNFEKLLKQHHDELASAIVWEHGKSHADAKGDVFRGYEIAEHACSFNSLLQGETLANVAKDVDITSFRTPIGVCAGITPHNFPAMVPLWMYPMPSPPETPSSSSLPNVSPTPLSLSSTSSKSLVSPLVLLTVSRVESPSLTTSATTKISALSPSSVPTDPVNTSTNVPPPPERELRSTWEPRTTPSCAMMLTRKTLSTP